MNKPKILFLILLVFASGVVAGVVGTRIIIRNQIRKAVQNPETVRERLEVNLTRGLNLSATQQAQIHEIFIRTHDRVRQLRMEFQPRFDELLAQGKDEIALVLNEDQKREFLKRVQEHESRWKPR